MSVPVRLGGMALSNGVLVHGPRYWACAIRAPDGELRVVSGEKGIRSVDVASPLARAPVRIAEMLALLPAVRRALPEVELPFLSGRTLTAMAGISLVLRMLRASRLGVAAQEGIGALLAISSAALTVRGTEIAAYHGAEHIAIGSYEHGERRPREHERCGSHVLGPLFVTTVVGHVLVGKVGSSPEARALARVAVSAAALVAAIEIFGWALRHPGHPLSRALAWPGRELQTRFLTAEPTQEQLAVAEAALAECLRLETEAPAGLAA